MLSVFISSSSIVLSEIGSKLIFRSNSNGESKEEGKHTREKGKSKEEGKIKHRPIDRVHSTYHTKENTSLSETGNFQDNNTQRFADPVLMIS